MTKVQLLVKMYGSDILTYFSENCITRQAHIDHWCLSIADTRKLLAMYRIKSQPFFGEVTYG